MKTKMIEVSLPRRPGTFYLDKTAGVVYTEDKKTAIIYREPSGKWCYLLSYNVFEPDLIALLDEKMV